MVATAATQPVDVLKTRMMNAQPGEYKSIMQCFLYTAKTGPLGFFKVQPIVLLTFSAKSVNSLKVRIFIALKGLYNECIAEGAIITITIAL